MSQSDPTPGRSSPARRHMLEGGEMRQRWSRRSPGPRQRVRSRWLAVGAATAVLVLSVLGTIGADGVSAQDGFHNGDAQASGDGFTLNIQNANANIGLTYGRSIAGYRGTSALSQARALDLGVLPTLLGQPQCDGSPPLLNLATLPPQTIADSATAGSDKSQLVQAFVPGFNQDPKGDLAGTQDATATPQPSSYATTQSVPADMGLLAMDNAKTETWADLKDGTREAHAVVTADNVRILGSMFVLDHPRWEATARTGAQTTSTGSFTFTSATVLGFTRSAADALGDFAGFKAGVEQVLSGLGVVLEFPQVTVRDDGVAVTPLTFRIQNPPIGTDLLGPFFSSELVRQLKSQAIAQDCKNQATLQVLDVLVAALTGNGAVEISAGGVDAASHDIDYSVAPFPTATDTPADTTPAPTTDTTPVDLGATDAGASGLGASDALPTDAGLSTLDTTPTDLGSVDALPIAATPKGAARTQGIAALPSAASNRFEDSSSGTAAVVVGIVAILGALALSFGDRLLGRSARRRIP